MATPRSLPAAKLVIPLPLLVLLLIVPAPSLGAWVAMIRLPDTIAGQAIFLVCKLWLLLVPVAWHFLVDGGALSLSRPAKRGLVEGALLGAGLSAVILVVWIIAGQHLLDPPLLAAKMTAIGLDAWPLYTGMALYWILVNSLLEEMVWRWFVVNQLGRLVPAGWAIPLSALFFSLHHTMALGVYMSLPAVMLGTAGVFAGGCIWSWLYLRWGSIWPAWVSHMLVDLCIFAIGAKILFSGYP